MVDTTGTEAQVLHCLQHGGINVNNFDYIYSLVESDVAAGTASEAILGFAENLGIKSEH